jgi:hypothetical protein
LDYIGRALGAALMVPREERLMQSKSTRPLIGGGSLPRGPEFLDIARRLIWWLPPDEALDNPARFLAQVMTLGTWDDVQRVRAKVGEGRLREVLLDAPPGVFDQRSWNYWHKVFDMEPAPPLPRRKLP